MKLEKRAVKRVAAGFQYHIREASGSAAELGIRRAGLHLELLNRIHRRKHHRAECIVILGVVYALDQNTVPIVGGPDAVNGGVAHAPPRRTRQAARIAVEGGHGARRQEDQGREVARVQRQVRHRAFGTHVS